MDIQSPTTERILLIDTCGETAGVALCLGTTVMAEADLGRAGASGQIVGAVRGLLDLVGWELREVDAVGVVSGPGSFTGVRAGLAAAKGFCEAARLRMMAVSRLVVLVEASGMTEGVVALDAGRGEVFARDVATGREWLGRVGEVASLSGEVVVSEDRLMELLAKVTPRFCPLHVRDSLGAVLSGLREGDRDVALVEANYGRAESDIYARKTVGV